MSLSFWVHTLYWRPDLRSDVPGIQFIYSHFTRLSINASHAGQDLKAARFHTSSPPTSCRSKVLAHLQQLACNRNQNLLLIFRARSDCETTRTRWIWI